MDDTKRELLIVHYIDLRQYEKALSELRAALAAEPQEATWHLLWARVHYLLERYEEVEEHAQEALRLGHSPAPVFILLGRYYQAIERYGRARGAYQKALRLEPDNAVVYAAYAYLLIKMEEFKEAKRFMKRAMSLESDNPVVLSYYVKMKIALSKKQEQMEAMLMRIRSGGDEKTRQITMALYMQLRNDYQAAREHFYQAFLLDPLDFDVQEALYRTHLICHPLFWPMRLTFYIGGPHIAFYGTIPILFVGLFCENVRLGAACLLFFMVHTVYAILTSLTVQGLIARNRKRLRQVQAAKTQQSL